MRKTCILCSIISVLLCACGPIVKNPSPVFYPQSFVNPQAVPFAPNAEYRIQPGDTLDIKFFYNPTLNEIGLPVRPDGRVSLQLVGEVVVAGLTPEEAKRLLVEKYKNTELSFVELSLSVKTFGGQKIFVDGEVNGGGAFSSRRSYNGSSCHCPGSRV